MGLKKFFWDRKFFSKNDPYRGNFMRGIDCAHSRSMKTLPWPWFRKWIRCIEAKTEKNFYFRPESKKIDCAHFIYLFSKKRKEHEKKKIFDFRVNTPISFPESGSRKNEKIILTLIQGMEFVYWRENRKFFFFRPYTNSIPWIRVKIIFHA